MGFVKSFEELAEMGGGASAEFYDAEMLTLYWETKPEIVGRLVPPPLKPAERAVVMAFVANYPRTNFAPPYLEGALFLRATFDGVPGYYCLSMPVTGDLAMAGGREKFGFPKKMANISLERDGDVIEGSLERHGIPFFRVRAELNDRPNAEDFAEIYADISAPDPECVISYNFKAFLAPDGSGFDYEPRLVRADTTFRPDSIELGAAEVTMRSSDPDPWSEVEIVRMLGAVYTVGHNTLHNGTAVGEVPSLPFMPYAFLKWD